MLLLLTFWPLAAIVLAKPQYNYGNGVSATFGGSAGGGRFGYGTGSSNFIGGGGLKFTGGNSGFSNHGSSFTHGSSLGVGSSFGGSSLVAGSYSGSQLSGSSNNFNEGGQLEAPLVHKQFITVAAPEDSDNLERSKHLVIGRPQKNYRVVFIKAPSSSNANIKLSAEYAPQEEKTVIYVLSKKDSSLDVGDIATPAPTVPSKPEVFFIKYKTEEEAQHAQRQIQAEYDKIEGSSEHTDAGVAPQQSVIGILDNGAAAGVGIGIGTGTVAGIGSDTGSFNIGRHNSNSGGGHSSGSLNVGNSVFFDNPKSSTYLPPAAH